MSCDHGGLWAALPSKVQHPFRAAIVEALWRSGEPLSARALVDALDGLLSMWEVAHHLRNLEELGVVEPTAVDAGRKSSMQDRFDVPYRLKDWESEES